MYINSEAIEKLEYRGIESSVAIRKKYIYPRVSLIESLGL